MHKSYRIFSKKKSKTRHRRRTIHEKESKTSRILNQFHIMNTAQERLMYMQYREKRLLYGSYKAYHEGPADNSCWVIPGKLLMSLQISLQENV